MAGTSRAARAPLTRERIVDAAREIFGIGIGRRHQAKATAQDWRFGHPSFAAGLPAGSDLHLREWAVTIACLSPRRPEYKANSGI